MVENEAYRQIAPYPFTILTLDVPNDVHEGKYELLLHVTRTEDYKWTGQVFNFARWERDDLGEYQAHGEMIATPIVSFLRLDNLKSQRKEKVEANFIQMYFKPIEFEVSDTNFSMDVTE